MEAGSSELDWKRSTMTVVVFGSANVDLVVPVNRHPSPGETVSASAPTRLQAGGKGLNQAIAASRSAAHPTTFIGAVGRDANAGLIAAALADAGVDAQLRQVENVATGTAIVTVDAHGENSIVVVAGANACLTTASDHDRAILRDADVAVFQGEVPTGGFEAVARASQEAGTLVLLNAAPAWPLSTTQAELVDVLVVNETECIEIARGFGIRTELRNPATLCAELTTIFPAVVVTLGADGAVWSYRGSPAKHVRAPRVDVVDTTGAGDTFCGVVAAQLAGGRSLSRSVADGVQAAALTVTRPGAAAAIPGSAELSVSTQESEEPSPTAYDIRKRV